MQDINAEHFATLRSVHTGSWLGLAHQGKGLGKEMRQAILHLAFAGLGALEAHSGAFFDNEASLATSRSVGYRPNGEAIVPRRDGSARMINVRLDRATWEERRRDDIELVGLEGCLDMFIAAPAKEHNPGVITVGRTELRLPGPAEGVVPPVSCPTGGVVEHHQDLRVERRRHPGRR